MKVSISVSGDGSKLLEKQKTTETYKVVEKLFGEEAAYNLYRYGTSIEVPNAESARKKIRKEKLAEHVGSGDFDDLTLFKSKQYYIVVKQYYESKAGRVYIENNKARIKSILAS